MINFSIIGSFILGTIGMVLNYQEFFDLFIYPCEKMWVWLNLLGMGLTSFSVQFFVTSSFKYQSAALCSLNNSAFGIITGFAMEILYFKVKPFFRWH